LRTWTLHDLFGGHGPRNCHARSASSVMSVRDPTLIAISLPSAISLKACEREIIVALGEYLNAEGFEAVDTLIPRCAIHVSTFPDAASPGGEFRSWPALPRLSFSELDGRAHAPLRAIANGRCTSNGERSRPS
jgi:hypothetical protein